jgi:hypothetical protein
MMGTLTAGAVKTWTLEMFLNCFRDTAPLASSWLSRAAEGGLENCTTMVTRAKGFVDVGKSGDTVPA